MKIEKGQRVKLGPGVRHQEVAGMVGTAKRYIKSRGVVEVKLDNGKLYDARPENLEEVA